VTRARGSAGKAKDRRGGGRPLPSNRANHWAHEVVERETGSPPLAIEPVFEDALVGVALAHTPRGTFLAVRTPLGETLAPLTRADAAVSVPTDALDGAEAYAAELEALHLASADIVAIDPHVLAQATGAPVSLVKRWQAAAEMLAIEGIAPRDAALLARAGVDGLHDLARRAPRILARDAARRAEAEGLPPFDESKVDAWIDEARRRVAAGTLKTGPGLGGA